jgi:hypothetical protein
VVGLAIDQQGGRADVLGDELAAVRRIVHPLVDPEADRGRAGGGLC